MRGYYFLKKKDLAKSSGVVIVELTGLKGWCKE